MIMYYSTLPGCACAKEHTADAVGSSGEELRELRELQVMREVEAMRDMLWDNRKGQATVSLRMGENRNSRWS